MDKLPPHVRVNMSHHEYMLTQGLYHVVTDSQMRITGGGGEDPYSAQRVIDDAMSPHLRWERLELHRRHTDALEERIRLLEEQNQRLREELYGEEPIDLTERAEKGDVA